MTITGTIKDNTGQTVPFANVFLSDSKGRPIGNGVVADANGNYSLDAAGGNFITASFVGMAPQTQTVSTNLTINFTLQPDAGSTFNSTDVTTKRPIPWMLILWVSVAIGGTIFLIIKISKDYKHGQK